MIKMSSMILLSLSFSPSLLPEMGVASPCGPSGRTHPRFACEEDEEEEEEDEEGDEEEDDEEGEGSVMKVMRTPLPPPPPAQLYSRYDLDELDVAWLGLVNQEFRQMGTFTTQQPASSVAEEP